VYIEALDGERFAVVLDLLQNFDVKDGKHLRVESPLRIERRANCRNDKTVRAIVDVVRLSGDARPEELR
jgi:hypothetical protein